MTPTAPPRPPGAMTVAAFWETAPTLDPRRHQHAARGRAARTRRWRFSPLACLSAAAFATTLAAIATTLPSRAQPAPAVGGSGAEAWMALYGHGWRTAPAAAAERSVPAEPLRAPAPPTPAPIPEDLFSGPEVTP